MRTISTRHAERVLAVKLDKPAEIPHFFFEMFDEGDNNQMLMSSLSLQDDLPSMTPQLYLRSPSSTSLFSPSVTKIPSLGDLQAIQSPLLKTPNMLTSGAPFWTNPLELSSFPTTPKTPHAFELMEHPTSDNIVSSSVPNIDTLPHS